MRIIKTITFFLISAYLVYMEYERLRDKVREKRKKEALKKK